MGIYWIAGAVVRSIQQLVINNHIDKIDMDELLQRNLEKANKKREKRGLPPQKMTNNAKISTRNIDTSYTLKNTVVKSKKADIQKEVGKIPENVSSKRYAKPGSLAEKAMMVKEYNDSHNKK